MLLDKSQVSCVFCYFELAQPVHGLPIFMPEPVNLRRARMHKFPVEFVCSREKHTSTISLGLTLHGVG